MAHGRPTSPDGDVAGQRPCTTLETVREVTLGLTALAIVWAGVGYATWVVSRRARPLLGVVAAVGVVLVSAFLTTVAGLFVGLGTFGVIHGWYLAGVLSIPLLGVGILVTEAVSGARASRRPVMAVGAVLLVPALVGFYATHVAPFRLRVQTVDAALPSERSGRDTIRIAVLSDIQTTAVGDLERRAVREAMAAEPDIVLLPGDVLQGDMDQVRDAAPAMKQLLSELHAPGGVYLVGGDVETAEHLALVRPDGMTLLDDEVATTTVGDRTVAIGGTALDYDSPSAVRVKDELMAQDPGTVRILLSHRPDTVLGLPDEADIDLTVAGHTHGGQVSLPVVGPLLTLTAVPRDVAAGGLHRVDGNQIYVSPGIGMERGHAPQIRFGVPPTVGIVDLG